MINFLATFAYYFQLLIIGLTTLCGSLFIILILLATINIITEKLYKEFKNLVNPHSSASEE